VTTLLAFDFDGTLAPICDDPNEARLTLAAAALLDEATHVRGCAVAILTGRDIDDILQRADTSGAYVVASHGLEIRGPGGTSVREMPPLHVTIDQALLGEICGSGLRLEWKKHGVALHWRGIPYEAIEPVVEAFRTWTLANDLALLEGRCVAEARCRGGGKEEALRWLARAIGARRILYAGDDLTDFGPLQFASANGRAFFMESSERAAPKGVRVVSSFRELFQLIREEVMI